MPKNWVNPKFVSKREKMDRRLERSGLLNYQTEGLAPEEIARRYAAAGISINGKSQWFKDNYGFDAPEVITDRRQMFAYQQQARQGQAPNIFPQVQIQQPRIIPAGGKADRPQNFIQMSDPVTGKPTLTPVKMPTSTPLMNPNAQTDWKAQDFDWMQLSEQQKKDIIGNPDFRMNDVQAMGQQGFILSDSQYGLYNQTKQPNGKRGPAYGGSYNPGINPNGTGYGPNGDLQWWQPAAYTALSNPYTAPLVQGGSLAIMSGGNPAGLLAAGGITAAGYAAMWKGNENPLLNWIGEQAEKGMYALNYGAQTLEQAAGTMEYLRGDEQASKSSWMPIVDIYRTVKDIVKAKRLGEFISDPELRKAVWDSSVVYYDTKGIEKNPIIGNYIDKLYANDPQKAADTKRVLNAILPITRDEGEVWVLGEAEAVPVKPGYTMEDARKKMLSGEYTTQMLIQEYQQAYGFSGVASDFLLQSVFDPLNVADSAVGYTKGKIADARATRLDAVGTPEAIARAQVERIKARVYYETPSANPFTDKVPWSETARKIRSGLHTAAKTDANIANALTPWERKVAGITPDGSIAELTPSAPSKIPAFIQNLFTLNPDAKLRLFLDRGASVMQGMFDYARGESMSATDMVGTLRSVANADMTALKNAGAEYLSSPEAYTIISQAKDFLPKMEAQARTFDALAAERQRVIDALTALGGDKTVMQKGFTQADWQRLLKTDNPLKADIDAGRITYDSLRKDFDLFKYRKDGTTKNALTMEEFNAKTAAAFEDHTLNWGKEYFGVNKASTFEDGLRALKGLQSLLLLDISPTSIMNDIINERVMIATTGTLGLTDSATIARFNDDMGVKNPGAQSTGGMGDAAQANPDPVSRLTKGSSVFSKAADAIQSVRSKLPRSKITSKTNEAHQSQVRYHEMKKFMSRYWTEGQGYKRMSPSLENRLREYGYDPATVYQNLRGTFRPEQIDALMNRATTVDVQVYVQDAATVLGKDPAATRAMLDELGVLDNLKAALEKAQTPEQRALAFDRVTDTVMNSIDVRMARQLKTILEQTRNKIKMEGPAGTIQVFQEMALDYLNRKMDNDRIWDEAYQVTEGMEPDQRNAIMSKAARENRAAWTRTQARQAALYVAAIEGLGMTNDFGRTFLANLGEEQRILRKYFEDHGAKADKLSRQGGAWYESFAEEFNTRWAKDYGKVMDLQRKRGKMFVEEMKRTFGEQAEPMAQQWIDGVINATGTIDLMTREHRDSLKGLPFDERKRAWEKFKPEALKAWAERTKLDMAGAANLYKWDENAPYVSEYIDKANADIEVMKQADNERRAGVWAVAEQFGFTQDLKSKGHLEFGVMRKPEYGGIPDLKGLQDPRMTPELVQSVLTKRAEIQSEQARMQPELTPQPEPTATPTAARNSTRTYNIGDNTKINTAIKEMGGIDVNLARDLIGDTDTRRTGGLFKVNGRTDLDIIAIELKEYGYPIDLNNPDDIGGMNQLRDMIQRQVAGDDVYPMGKSYDKAIEKAARAYANEALEIEQTKWKDEADTLTRALDEFNRMDPDAETKALDLVNRAAQWYDTTESIWETAHNNRSLLDTFTEINERAGALYDEVAQFESMVNDATRAAIDMETMQTHADGSSKRQAIHQQSLEIFGEEQGAYLNTVTDLQADQWARMTGRTREEFYATRYDEIRRDGGGEMYQIETEYARNMDYPTRLPDTETFRAAVENTPNATLTDEGVIIKLVRRQKEEQSGSPSVRTGVFYLVEGDKNLKHYKTGKSGYGGTVEIKGETLLKAPFEAKGSTGGKAPEFAYDAIMGRGEYQRMRSYVLDNLGGLFKRGLPTEQILSDFGIDESTASGLANYIDEFSKQGNTKAYAIQEAIVAEAVRNAGYDSIVGISKRRDGTPFIAEVFDLRESTYPTEYGDFNINPQFGGEPLWQQVFHGSPYKFDKFTLDKIGSGEGAQAYGWGLYFAGDKAVGEYYRQKLSKGSDQPPQRFFKGQSLEPGTPEYHAATLMSRSDFGGSLKKARQSMTEWIRQGEIDLQSGRLDNRTLDGWKRTLEILNEATSKKDFTEKPNTGQLYKVEIPDDGYLLWDKPLSEQPESVQQALRKLDIKDVAELRQQLDEAMIEYNKLDFGKMRLTEIWDTPEAIRVNALKQEISALEDLQRGRNLYGYLVERNGSPQGASLALKEAGINGIQYLDGSSRGKGEGNYNYVIFDDAAIDILETYYQQAGINAKGGVDFASDGRATIYAMQSADVSTGIHEHAHVFLESMYRTVDEALPKYKRSLDADVKTLKDWTSLKQEGDTWTAANASEYKITMRDGQYLYQDPSMKSPLTFPTFEQAKYRLEHEMFARGFEKYMADGKAPSIALRNLFMRFAEWLKEIYNSAIKQKAITNVEISEPMRGLYNRLLTFDHDAPYGWKGLPDAESRRATTDVLVGDDIMARAQAERERLTQPVVQEVTPEQQQVEDTATLADLDIPQGEGYKTAPVPEMTARNFVMRTADGKDLDLPTVLYRISQEKPGKTGYTKTQTEYIAQRLTEFVNNGEALRRLEIDVPGDNNRITVYGDEGANNLHNALTGKDMPGMEGSKKPKRQSGAKKTAKERERETIEYVNAALRLYGDPQRAADTIRNQMGIMQGDDISPVTYNILAMLEDLTTRTPEEQAQAVDLARRYKQLEAEYSQRSKYKMEKTGRMIETDTPPALFQAGADKVWQYTLQQYADIAGKDFKPWEIEQTHRVSVEQAYHRGDPIPEAVLDEYPHLMNPEAERYNAPDAIAMRDARREELARQYYSDRNAREEARFYQQDSDPAPVWYLKLERTIAAIPQETMTAQQMRGALTKAGVKADEMYWTGFDEWLDSKKPGEKVTRAEAMQAITPLDIEEVTKGYQERRILKMQRSASGEFWAWDVVDDQGNVVLSEVSQSKAEDTVDNYYDGKGPTKYSQYTLPGGENYREVLFKLPGNEQAQVDYLAGRTDTISPIDNVYFKSGHWDEPNVLAHTRLNDRIDADGKRVLFVEEIQSDWHQAGREKGYAPGEVPNGWTIKQETTMDAETGRDVTNWVAYDANGTQKGPRYADVDMLIRDFPRRFPEEWKGKVPNAPFAKTWQDMVMKRILRMAAEGGYDRVAWTTGAQQAARYDLAKQVKHIAWEANEDGTYNIAARTLDDKPALYKEDIPIEEVRDIVGKDITNKILAGEGRTDADPGYRDWRYIEGDDLSVGNQGMKGFYDNMLPAFVDKYAKKWGARTGGTRIQVTKEQNVITPNGLRNTYEDMPVHSVDVTPEMRRSVMLGQPLFQQQPTTPAPIPTLPPGGYDQHAGFMDVGKILYDGWSDEVKPVLDEMKRASQKKENRYNFEGMDGQTRKELNLYLAEKRGELATAKNAARRWGDEMVDFTILDYRRQYGFDKLLGAAVPYEFYGTRSMLNWATRLVDRPQYLAHFARLQHLRETYDSQLPERMRGKYWLPTPFMPEWGGDGVFIDPKFALFPWTQFMQPLEAMKRENANINNSATYQLRNWAEEGTITEAEAAEALNTRSGPLWEKAIEQSRVEQGENLNSSADYFSMLFGPALYLTVPYYLATGEKFMGINSSYPSGQLPITRTAQALETAFKDTPLEWLGNTAGLLTKPENMAREALDLPKYGEWGDYYIDRQLANMAAEGMYTAEQVQIAMLERKGPIYDEAEERVRYEMMLRIPGMAPLYNVAHGATFDQVVGSLLPSLFPGGLLPPAEMEYKGLKQEYGLAWDQWEQGNKEALNQFFENHPEYQARLALRRDPSERLEQFLKSQIYEAYGELGETDQKTAKAEIKGLDEYFDAMRENPGQSFSIEQLTRWAQMLGAAVPSTPETQPTIDSTQPIEYMAPEITAITDIYYEQRKSLHPNYWELEGKYYDLPKSERRTFLIANPELKAYWDWKRSWYDRYPELQPIFKGEVFKEVDTSTWNPMLVEYVADYAYSGTPLPTGAYKALRQVWINEGKPRGSVEEWLKIDLAPAFLYGN